MEWLTASGFFENVSSNFKSCDVNLSCYDDYKLSISQSTMRTEDEIIVPTVWGIIMILGLFGNLLVSYVMIRYADNTATNCFVINLSLTDLAFTVVVIPLTMIHYVLPSWNLGAACCKFQMYTIYVLLFATCLTLTAMTVDRYFSICHPITSLHRRTPRTATLINVISWTTSLVLGLPFAVYHDLVGDEPVLDGKPQGLHCREVWPSKVIGKIAITYVVIITYVLPLTLIVTCYTGVLRNLYRQQARHSANGPAGSALMPKYNLHRSFGESQPPASEPATSASTLVVSQAALRRALTSGRRRRKATKMVAVIVALFAVSWLPIHVFQLWFHFDDDFPRTSATYLFKIVAHTISYANSSCVNPITYCVLGDGFRKALVRWWPQLFNRHNARRNAPLCRQRPVAETACDDNIGAKCVQPLAAEVENCEKDEYPAQEAEHIRNRTKPPTVTYHSGSSPSGNTPTNCVEIT